MNRRRFLGCFACAWTAGCTFDNGLPASIATLLKSNGIDWPIQTSHAGLGTRSATLSLAPNEVAQSKAIDAFELPSIESDSKQYDWLIHQLHIRPLAAWGLAGRPPQFRLDNGRQLEYLYLLQTSEENVVMLVSYAYGKGS